MALHNQCCVSMNFGMDPDPAIFVSDLQDVFCLLLYEGTFTSFVKKLIKKSQKSRNQHCT
jgi:hypothetical protein